MLTKAYNAQCASVAVHCTHPSESKNRRFTLFALAFGTFCIGTSEFASMGNIQLFSDSFRVDISTATNAITAYAFGVVVGAPLVTLVASRLNRRTLLLYLMALFVAGNLLSAISTNLGILIVARFTAGMPQGAYFGAGAVVDAYIVGPRHAGKAFALVMAALTVATIVGRHFSGRIWAGATHIWQSVSWPPYRLGRFGYGSLGRMLCAEALLFKS